MLSFQERRNLVEHREENWRPPLFTPATTAAQKMAAALRRFLDLQAGSIWIDLKRELGRVEGTLLDVGCGAQPYRGLLPPGVAYIGLDTSDAKTRFGYEIPDTLYFSGDTWPLGDESSDCILCTETLEHVLEPYSLLQEAYRCLRPGGRFILTVPFAARWHFIPYDYWRYTPSSLHHLLTTSGFKDIVVYARGNAVTVACYKTMALVLAMLFSKAQPAVLRLLYQFIGVLFVPILLALAIVANISLAMPGGDDCLGYTVLAHKETSRTVEESHE